ETVIERRARDRWCELIRVGRLHVLSTPSPVPWKEKCSDGGRSWQFTGPLKPHCNTSGKETSLPQRQTSGTGVVASGENLRGFTRAPRPCGAQAWSGPGSSPLIAPRADR